VIAVGRDDWRQANAGHVSLVQLQVMSAIEQCRSAALGRACRALRGLRPQPHRQRNPPDQIAADPARRHDPADVLPPLKPA
jgi:hypothetical protein